MDTPRDEEARLTEAERNTIWACECGHSATRHNSRGCTAKVNGGEFADDCKISMGEIVETNIERTAAERVAQAKAEALDACLNAIANELLTDQNHAHDQVRNLAVKDCYAAVESLIRPATPSGGESDE